MSPEEHVRQFIGHRARMTTTSGRRIVGVVSDCGPGGLSILSGIGGNVHYSYGDIARIKDLGLPHAGHLTPLADSPTSRMVQWRWIATRAVSVMVASLMVAAITHNPNWLLCVPLGLLAGVAWGMFSWLFLRRFYVGGFPGGSLRWCGGWVSRLANTSLATPGGTWYDDGSRTATPRRAPMAETNTQAALPDTPDFTSQSYGVGHLAGLLGSHGLATETVGDYPTGVIMNVTASDGAYLYTVTVSRTEGH